jgi:ABC-type Na+ efflux pump permease subunit
MDWVKNHPVVLLVLAVLLVIGNIFQGYDEVKKTKTITDITKSYSEEQHKNEVLTASYQSEQQKNAKLVAYYKDFFKKITKSRKVTEEPVIVKGKAVLGPDGKVLMKTTVVTENSTASGTKTGSSTATSSSTTNNSGSSSATITSNTSKTGTTTTHIDNETEDKSNTFKGYATFGKSLTTNSYNFGGGVPVLTLPFKLGKVGVSTIEGLDFDRKSLNISLGVDYYF